MTDLADLELRALINRERAQMLLEETVEVWIRVERNVRRAAADCMVAQELRARRPLAHRSGFSMADRRFRKVEH